MTLSKLFEHHGSWLFKYRGQMPVLLFIFVVPVIFTTEYDPVPNKLSLYIEICSVLITCAGFAIRAYTVGTTPRGTSGRNRNEQVAETLNNTGIYSVVRHPLYLGNYFMWIGIVLYVENVYFFIIVNLLFLIFYERIMYTEEKHLHKKFGDVFTEWTMRVPAFIPSIRNFVQSATGFSFKSVLRREYAGLLAAIIGFSYVNFLKNYSINHTLTLDAAWLYALIIISIIAFTLRTIRHTTDLLNENERS